MTATTTTTVPTSAATSRSRIRRLVLEPEADAADGRDPRGALGGLELLPQPPDRGVEGLGGAEPVLVPHLAHQRLAGDDRAALGVEQREDVELLRGQGDLAARDECATRPGVDAQGV